MHAVLAAALCTVRMMLLMALQTPHGSVKRPHQKIDIRAPRVPGCVRRYASTAALETLGEAFHEAMGLLEHYYDAYSEEVKHAGQVGLSSKSELNATEKSIFFSLSKKVIVSRDLMLAPKQEAHHCGVAGCCMACSPCLHAGMHAPPARRMCSSTQLICTLICSGGGGRARRVAAGGAAAAGARVAAHRCASPWKPY